MNVAFLLLVMASSSAMDRAEWARSFQPYEKCFTELVEQNEGRPADLGYLPLEQLWAKIKSDCATARPPARAYLASRMREAHPELKLPAGDAWADKRLDDLTLRSMNNVVHRLAAEAADHEETSNAQD